MRVPLPALAILAALALPAVADDAPKLELAVGDERTGLGTMPRCDDLTIVAITADGRGVRGLKPGSTTCSFDTSGGGGIRRIYRVVVLDKAAAPATAGTDVAPAREDAAKSGR